MAGVPGNAATFAFGKQTAKGTAQTTPQYKLKVTTGDIAPVRTLITLAETDATRQAGQVVVTGANVTGTVDHYLRPTEFASIAYWALGANADSGAGPYTHTATAASSGPYVTIYKAINVSSLVDQYVDCQISSLTVRGGAGQALTYAVLWDGLTVVLGATDPVLAATTEVPLTYPNVTVTKGGATPGTIDSFEIIINNSLSFIQGDSGLSNSDVVRGLFDVSGTFTALFATDADYRSFHTGTAGGTALTTTVFNEALSIACVINANLSVTFTLPQVEYRSLGVPINVTGAPIIAAYTWHAKPQATASSTLSIVTKNAAATA